MDLAACVDEPVVIAPHGRAVIPTGIAIALPIVITQNPDVLALPLSLGAAAQWVGLAVLFLVGWLLYRVGRKGEQATPAKG